MKYVLITGATAGIGKEIAYSYASRGYNLFLIARREKRLIEISKQISDEFNINVRHLVSDLKDKNSPKEIYDFADKNSLDIDTLVLNAGYQHNKNLEEVSIEDEEDCLRVLGISVIMQTKLFLSHFRKRGGGNIMVVSSVAAFAPPSGEFAVLYGPVKTFMNRFVDSINSSQAKHNIFASALCPGFTITEFHQQSGTQERMDKVPAFMKMSAKDVAEAGVNGILNKKSLVIPGVIYKLIVILFKFTPLWLVRFLGNKLAGGRFKT